MLGEKLAAVSCCEKKSRVERNLRLEVTWRAKALYGLLAWQLEPRSRALGVGGCIGTDEETGVEVEARKEEVVTVCGV